MFSLYKTVVRKCIQPKPARMTFTVSFRLNEEFRYMGRKAIYIKRYEKAHRVRTGKQLQYSLKILTAAEGHRFFSYARKKQPE